MTSFTIVMNAEYIGNKAFVVALMFGRDGQQHDAIIRPYESLTDISMIAIEYLRNFDTVYVETSSTEVYEALHQTARVLVTLKHRSDTEVTRSYVRQYEKVLVGLYDIELPEAKKLPPLRGWRKWLYRFALKITRGFDVNGI